MSTWLNDGEVLEGQGSGEAVPVSPRPQSLSPGTPRLSKARSPVGSPTLRKATAAASPQSETMGKAKQLFALCDKGGKGFITKRDMQRLQMELPLSPEQLESVFESLDRQCNGFITPLEFSTGLGELMGTKDTVEQSQELAGKETDRADWSEDAATIRLTDILTELGIDKLSDSQQELCSVWCELQREQPELLKLLEGILLHAVTHLRDSIRERDSLEQALRRRESEHDQFVRSIYEEMETQIREEREKCLAQESIKQKQRGIQIEEELKLRDHELEITLSRQKQLESRMQQLAYEQANIKQQNQELRSLNVQLQEQAERSSQQLQAAMLQLTQLQLSAAQEQVDRQQNVTQVSRNIQKEKESLLRQLGLLRDMNKRLRDDKDAQLTKKRNPNMEEHLQKRGSVVGHNFLPDGPVKSPRHERQQGANNSKASHRVNCQRVGQHQHVFKVVFLGNSGVGKSSFIQHYCRGHFGSTTTGVDFQMRTVTLGSTSITLQLWDTAGQERFHCVTEQYYRKADAVLVMYDITCPASFATAGEWLHTVEEKMCHGATPMLLGNKLDLADRHHRKVESRDGLKLAEQHQASFYECSAKTGANMEEPMTRMAEKLVARLDGQREDSPSLTKCALPRRCCV